MKRTRGTTALSIAAIMAVAALVIGVATTVSSATSAYASSNTKQAKVVVENKCANVDDNNKRVHTEDVRCEINHDTISGISSLPFLIKLPDGQKDHIVTLQKTK